MTDLGSRTRALGDKTLRGMARGIEKEGLRCDAAGRLARTPHPTALGRALTHRHITTDFSESQLELVTSVFTDVDDCLRQLTEIHQAVMHALGDELMWGSSMPCELPALDADIPIGQYGSSNIGRIKTIYRRGLSHRYGARMQTISGLHYNWSLPGLVNEDTFALIRNFRRHSFVLLVLFGASPAVSPGFVSGAQPSQPADAPLHLPFATSRRMGPLGYQSDAQASLAVSYNDLDGYADSLQDALTRHYPAYEAIGLRDNNGAYQQLATTLLQIENEFYSTIRPKRVIRPGERPLHALRARGVEYVEVRCMDLDPFASVGITASTMRMLDVFLLHCLLSESPPDTPAEIAALARNQHRVATDGRDPALQLERAGAMVDLRPWGAQVLDECAPIAAALDETLGGCDYAKALAAAQASWNDPATLPSGRVLKAMDTDHGGSFQAFALAQSARAKGELLARGYPAELGTHFETLAQASRDEQARREAADCDDFEAFREHYLSPERLSAAG